MSKKLLYILLGIGTFVICYQVIRPLYTGAGEIWQPETGVQSLQDLNAEYDQTLIEAEKLKSQAESLKTDYDNIPPDQQQEMKVMVPDSIDKVRLLSELTGLLALQGYPAQSLAIAEEGNSTDGKGTYSISFSVKTNYPRFKDLMQALEKSMRLLSVRAVSFTTPEKEGDPTTYQVRFSTYYLK